MLLSIFRFVLFKRHYDKYVALATKYEEAKGVAYYLEERYHEVKVCTRSLFVQNWNLFRINFPKMSCECINILYIYALKMNKLDSICT